MRRSALAGFTVTLLAMVLVAPVGAQSPLRLEGEWIAMTARARDTPPSISDIFMMRPDGSGLVNLTNGVARDSGPELSPDGTAIAFASYLPEGGGTHVWLMDVDGTNRRFVGVDHGSEPTWTPDGRSIVYSDGSGLRVVERSGAADRSIVTLPGDNPSVLNPEVSPDGSTVVFDAWAADGDRQVFAVAIDGGQVVQLTSEGGFEPTWSPDGGRILFTSFREGPEGNFWEMNPDGSDVQHAFLSESNDFHATWAPDGDHVAFEAVRNDGFAIVVYDEASQTTTDLVATTDDEPTTYRGPTWVAVTLASVCDADPVVCVAVPPGDADSDGFPGTTATTTTAVAISPGAESGTPTAVAPAPSGDSSSDSVIIVLLIAVVLALAFGVGIAVGGRRVRGEPPPPPPPPPA